MVPLAITSTAGWIRRLGGKRWQAAPLVYLSAVAGVVHYYWLVKSDIHASALYGFLVGICCYTGWLWKRLIIVWRGNKRSGWRHFMGSGGNTDNVGMPLADRFEIEAMPHLNDIFRTAYRILGDRPRAEDVVQEVFLQAWKSFERYEAGTNCRAWLFQDSVSLRPSSSA